MSAGVDVVDSPLVAFPELPPPGLDVSGARRFGEPIFLLGRREIPPFDVARMAIAFRAALSSVRFDRQRDYIGMTGSSVALAVLAAVAARGGAVRFLVFDASTCRYVVARLPSGGSEG